MTTRTRAVLFDFGGVFTPSPFDGARSYGAQIGASPERVLELVFGPYHEDTDHPWHRLERGEIALMDARNAILELGRAEGVDADPFKLFASMANGPRGAYDAMVARARAVVERGYRTALVTNNIVEFRESWRKMLPTGELFQVIVDSSEVRMRKPNPAIFQHTLALLGEVAPEECLFLDDAASNVAAAEALGIRGVLVKSDLADALAALDALL
ncbi:MAG: HAD family phosphatase [Deltaproteobacteria bacterium]|nr:HAD family phosphatase [Deltaproteobacteria bacterium]